MMMIDPSLKNPNSKMGRPPICKLVWGTDSKNHFQCVIISCNVKYLMFNKEGLPVRATASVVLREARDPNEQPAQNPTSIGTPGQRVRVVTRGDRLDLIAYQEYGDATLWPRIADANRLFDPLDLRPGMVLSIPAL